MENRSTRTPYEECYSAINWNKLLIHATIWVNLRRSDAKRKEVTTKGYILYDVIYSISSHPGRGIF